MSNFLSLLALHYFCDAASAADVLSRSEMQVCMANYQAIKAHFVSPEDPAAQGARNVAAYRAFKSWEAQNHVLVADLRGRALRDVDARALSGAQQ